MNSLSTGFSNTIAGVFGLGTTELVVILVILLVLFGGAKLPSLARGLGQSIKEFKKASENNNDDEKKKSEDKPGSSDKGA